MLGHLHQLIYSVDIHDVYQYIDINNYEHSTIIFQSNLIQTKWKTFYSRSNFFRYV